MLLDSYLNANFGDDLLISVLSSRYPDVEFGVFEEPEYLHRFGKDSSIRALGRLHSKTDSFAFRLAEKARLMASKPRVKFVRAFEEFDPDCYLWYGGSLFIENGSRTQIGRLGELVWASRVLSSSGVLDANFGPYHSDRFLRVCSDAFAGLEFVAFRDAESVYAFKNLPNVSSGADAVFLIDKDHYSAAGKVGEGVLAVVPINMRGRGDPVPAASYVDSLRATCEEWLEDAKHRVRLLEFCRSEGDDVVVGELKRLLARFGDRVAVVEYKDVDQMASLVAESDMVIASRFHGIFLAIALAIPVVPVSYSKKIDNLFRTLGYDGSIPSVGDWSGGFDDVVESAELRRRGKVLAEEMMLPFERLMD